MSEISFNEGPGYMAHSPARESFFVRTVLAAGLVKTRRDAETVLLVIVIALLVVAVLLYFFLTRSPSPRPLPSSAAIVNTPGTPLRLLTPLSSSP